MAVAAGSSMTNLSQLADEDKDGEWQDDDFLFGNPNPAASSNLTCHYPLEPPFHDRCLDTLPNSSPNLSPNPNLNANPALGKAAAQGVKRGPLPPFLISHLQVDPNPNPNPSPSPNTSPYNYPLPLA